MKISLITLVIFCSLNAFSQNLLPVQHDTNYYDQEFILNGNVDYSATSIFNEMSGKLLFGGSITQEMKDRSSAQHKGINRIGGEASAEFEYRNMKMNMFKKENWGLIVKAGYFNYASAIYSRDLFGLTFYGNDNYLGQDANFSGSRFSFQSFQKIGFGVIEKKTKSNISLNFYSLSNLAEGYLTNGYLYQTEAGDSLSLTLAGRFDYSASEKFLKGFGAGLDFDFRMPVLISRDKITYVQFQAKNLGVTHTVSEITRYAVDTLLTYNGFTFNQLVGDENVLNNGTKILDTLGIDSTSVSRYKFLPGYIQVGKIVDEMSKDRFQSFFGVRMYMTAAYNPLIYGGVQVKATNWLNVGCNASYGGYTRFRVGLYAQMKISDLSIGIATEDIVGDVSSRGKGKSVMLRLRYKL